MISETLLRDCTVDPGLLSGAAAVLAIGLHCGCGEGCLPRWRATDALDKEYVARPGAADTSAEDARFAEQLREAARLIALNHDIGRGMRT